MFFGVLDLQVNALFTPFLVYFIIFSSGLWNFTLTLDGLDDFLRAAVLSLALPSN
jgi:hypothetical protein